jgi:opacity protein-like surface antigen
MELRSVVLLAAWIVSLASVASAQEISEQRVRAAVDDAARGLGQSVAGGSPMTAPAATTGGLGHFMASLGIGGTRIDIEDPQRESGTVEFLLPTAGARFAVGLTSGVASDGPIGGTGSIDLLGRVGILTARDEIEDASKLYGIGVRVALLGETPLTPAISVALEQAWTEEIVYGEPDEVSFRGDVAVTSLRADISKDLMLLSPYAGAGIDRTRIDASYLIPAELSTLGTEIRGSIDPASTHHVLYVGTDLSLLLLTASIEGGVYDGGAFATFAIRAGL